MNFYFLLVYIMMQKKNIRLAILQIYEANFTLISKGGMVGIFLLYKKIFNTDQ